MKRKGFTLIELIVAMIIVTILASIVTPQLLKSAEKSRQAEAVDILMRMYKGYKTAIIDEVLCRPTSPAGLSNSYKFCNDSDNFLFNPDEDNCFPDYTCERSPMSWAVLGFSQNPNYDTNKLYFSYDFLKPVTGGWGVYNSHSTGSPSRSGTSGVRPGLGTYNSMNIGVAWRKTGNTCETGFYQYPINQAKYIFIDMDTGKIYKSSHYQ